MKQTILMTEKQRTNYSAVLTALKTAEQALILYRQALLDGADLPAKVQIGEMTDLGLDVSWPDAVPEAQSNV